MVGDTPENKNTGSACAGRLLSGLVADLYNQHSQELCNYLRSRYGDGPPEPEDVVQATFAKVSELDSLPQIENPKAFLFRTARNLLIDQFRRRVTSEKHLELEKEYAQAVDGTAVSGPERVLMSREELAMLESALRELDQRERDFLLLHRLHNLGFTEIGRRVGMSRNGVKAIIKRALEKCEQAVNQS